MCWRGSKPPVPPHYVSRTTRKRRVDDVRRTRRRRNHQRTRRSIATGLRTCTRTQQHAQEPSRLEHARAPKSKRLCERAHRHKHHTTNAWAGARRIIPEPPRGGPEGRPRGYRGVCSEVSEAQERASGDGYAVTSADGEWGWGTYRSPKLGPNPLEMCGGDGREHVLEALGIVVRHDVVAVKAARSHGSTQTCTSCAAGQRVGREGTQDDGSGNGCVGWGYVRQGRRGRGMRGYLLRPLTKSDCCTDPRDLAMDHQA